MRLRGLDSAERRAIEEALTDLHDDRQFWDLQAHSLAVFAEPHGLRSFRLPNRLTSALQVADRYYVKPLLRAITFPQTAFVLALAEGSARLVEVTPDLPPRMYGFPTCRSAPPAAGKSSIADRSPGRRLQARVRRPWSAVRAGVDRALRTFPGRRPPPDTGGPEPIDAIFRSVTTYPDSSGRDPRQPRTLGSGVGRAALEVLDGHYGDRLADCAAVRGAPEAVAPPLR